MTQTRSYAQQLEAEKLHFKDVANVHDLPAIFHYWSHTYLRPMVTDLGVRGGDHFFADFLYKGSIDNRSVTPAFVSIGAGNLDTEIRVAKLLRESGLQDFVIECVELNPAMLERGVAQASQEGVTKHIVPIEGDFNEWKATKQYDGIIANHSLHHVLQLEHLFREIKSGLKPKGLFVASDMIGRNGHQRWPEALELVLEFWKELPQAYRYNQQLKRLEEIYENWDCSTEGFEGIRAQDILPLLIKDFHFQVFVPFCNVISIFIDRNFGHNFNHEGPWDRDFIDRVHACDEAGFKSGGLKPTQMLAVMGLEEVEQPLYSRGLSPEECVRWPEVS